MLADLEYLIEIADECDNGLSIYMEYILIVVFFFSSRRRHTRLQGDWSSDVCSSDLIRSPEMTSKAFAVSSATASRIFLEDCLMDFLNRFTTMTMTRAGGVTSKASLVDRKSVV